MARRYTPAEIAEIQRHLKQRGLLMEERRKLLRKDDPIYIEVNVRYEIRGIHATPEDHVSIASDGVGPTAVAVRAFMVSFFDEEIAKIDKALLGLGMELVA